MSKFVAGYKFKPSHFEIHYLSHPSARRFYSKFSMRKSDAIAFDSEAAALAAVNKILDKTDRGAADGYYYVAVAGELNQ